MKFFVKLFLVLIVVFVGYRMLHEREDPYLSPEEKLVNNIIGKSARIIKEKYDLHPCGAGSSMPGGIVRKLILCFDTKEILTKEELRKLVIQCANEMLNPVLVCDEIQQYLVKRPFTIENIEVIIFNKDKKGSIGYAPLISTAQILQGILTYRSFDQDDIFKLKNEYNETYKEAMKICGNQIIESN
jgi:hypothetical protein